MKNWKRNKTIFTAILIGAALGISAGALSAYMTSSETATNTFTAGEVKIDLQEPAWKPEDGKHLVAKQTVLKDPKIKNTGKNSAYVFMTVQVPVRTLTLYNDAGRKEEYSETTELFNLKKNVNGIYETLSDTNSGNWVLLKDRSTYGTKDESFTTYVYAYRVPVEPSATSDALFDAVQLKNVIEGYSEMSKITTKDEYPITINGYAIQATDVIGADGSDVTDGTVTTEDLLRMYDTYVNQNGTGSGSSMNLMTDPSTQYKDGKMIIPELPKKTGYKNDGLWHDDNGHTYAAGTEVTVTDEMKKNGFNLHVNWEPITYTVRFNSNGGSGTMEDMTMTYDEAAALPTNKFTRNSAFVGWSLSSAGTIAFADNASIRNLTENDGDTVTLYALWKSNDFKVTYDANGGYFGTNTTKLVNTVVYHGNGYKATIKNGTVMEPSIRTGMFFDGWYTNAACTDGNEFKPNNFTNNTTAYAKWRKPIGTLVNNLSDKFRQITDHKENITAFKCSTEMPDLSMMSDKNIISTSDSETPVYCWVDGTELKYWSRGDKIKAGKSLLNMFIGFESLSDISGLRNIDTGNMTDMGRMFYGCSSLTDISPIANWDIGKVTDIRYLFCDCSSLTDIGPLANWNTGKMTDMESMFFGCSNLTDLSPLANWNIGNVTDMSSMFYGCSSLTDLSPIANWNIGNVTDMYSMFFGCSSLTDLDGLTHWNTENVTKMNSMFYRCNRLTDLSPLANWNTENVTDFSYMFRKDGDEHIKSMSLKPLKNWNVSKGTDFTYMFANNNDIDDITGINNWIFGDNANLYYMFKECDNLKNISNINWTFGNNARLNNIFYYCRNVQNISDIKIVAGEYVNAYDTFGPDTDNVIDLKNIDITFGDNPKDIYYVFDGYPIRTVKNFKFKIGNNTTGNKNQTQFYRIINGQKSTELESLDECVWEDIEFDIGENLCTGSGIFGIINGYVYASSIKNININVGDNTNCNSYLIAGIHKSISLDKLNLSIGKNCTGNNDAGIGLLFNDGETSKIENIIKNSTITIGENNKASLFRNALISDFENVKINVETNTSLNKAFYENKITSLDGIQINGIQNVADMSEMFKGCYYLTDASLANDWDISSGTNFTEMFRDCPSHPTFTKRAGTWDSDGTFRPAA